MALLKKSKTALPAILAITLIALAIVGFSYAHWYENLWLTGEVKTGNLCARFWGIVTRTDTGKDWTCDEGFNNVRQINKDIGSSNAYFIDTNKDGCNDTLVVELNNVYPCYYEHMAFWIHNCGTIPWKIVRVNFTTPYETKSITKPSYLTLDLNGDKKADIELYWGNNFGQQVDPCGRVDISFDIHVLQPCPENTKLKFTATIIMVNWNE
ncbi:MAG: hypothetical protein NZ932_04240 [Candidatus Bathyarchaeota archaeon]|nr:hypothetical protein [Candidatus Bathyarchaeota archaeon]MDW8040465.1 hypothetical protein [Nitrososphaerota archaeon]